MMKLSPAGLAFIKKFEAFVPFVYDDLRPVRGAKYGYREWRGEKPEGTLTIGYGHTDKARHPLKIRPGLVITEAQACEILDVDLDECEEEVRRLIKVPLTQGMFDALVSFQFNTGALAESTLRKLLNRGLYDRAPDEFRRYVFSKGRRLRGLERRRSGEIDLWLARPAKEPIAYAEEGIPSASVVPDRPEPEPIAKSRTAQGAGAAAAGGAVQTAVEVDKALEQLKEADGRLSSGTILGVAIGLAILTAALYALYARWDDAGRPNPFRRRQA